MPSWDEYFMSLASLVAQRSTCLRRKVGAVLVKDRRVLATGYNGAPSGIRHCSETGCLRDQLHVPSGERHELCRGIHAKQNVIIQSARFGVPIEGALLYCTTIPCALCSKMLINCRIAGVYYHEGYPDCLGKAMLDEAGIPIVQL